MKASPSLLCKSLKNIETIPCLFKSSANKPLRLRDKGVVLMQTCKTMTSHSCCCFTHVLTQMIAPEIEIMAEELGDSAILSKMDCTSDNDNKKWAMGE